MAIQAELFKQAFESDITKQLFASNSFIKNSKDDSAWINGAQVNLPHSGAAPSTAVDRSSFPATISKIADSASQYRIKTVSSDPTHIEWTDELVTNFNKRATVVSLHGDALNDMIADMILHGWAQGGDSENSWAAKPSLVRTSGTARAAGSPSATGTRKAVTLADILAVRSRLNKDNVSQNGRIAVITADMLDDLLNIEQFQNSDYNASKPLNSMNDESFSWMNMRWYVRSKTNVFSNAGTPALKAVGAAGATTDNGSALFFQKDFVRRAEGSVKSFYNEGVAEMYGDVLSAAVRVGAIGARTNGLGIVNLVEAAGA